MTHRQRSLLATLVLLAGAAAASEGPPSAPDAGLPARLVGRVLAMGTREPLVAHLALLDGGASVGTDTDGRFDWPLPPGAHEVRVAATGFEPRVYPEALDAGVRLEVLYRLQRTRAAYETVVRARRDATEAPRVELSRTEVHEVPGTLGDPFRVTMLLPGVASIASGLAYPVVRGTQPAATGFFLDGVRVPQLYHLLAGPAVVHPDFIDRVDFYSGAVPAAYGRLLGGVVDGRVARPSDALHATASVDLINAGGFVTVPLDALDLRVSLAGRVSYTPLVGVAVAQALFPSTPDIPRPTPVADFYDYQARVEWTGGPGRLRVLALGASDVAGARQSGGATATTLLTSAFHRVDFAWRWPAGGGSAEVGLTVGAERLGLLGERDGATFGRFLMRRASTAGRARWTRSLAEGLSLDVGVDVDRQHTGLEVDRDPSALGSEARSFRSPESSGALFGAFAEAQWLHGRWTVALGARADGYLLEPTVALWSFEPRASARLAVAPWLGVRGAAGLAHQPPTVLVNLPVSELAGLRDGLQQGARFELGGDARLPHALELSVTAFFNPVFRAVEFSLEDLVLNRASLSSSDAPGVPGRAYGVELMLRRRPEGRFFGWLSYTLLRAERFKRVYDFDASGDVTGSSQRWVPFEFDQTHVLNVTGGVLLPRGFRLSAALHFNTGRPETGTVSSRAMRPGVEASTYLPTWIPTPLWQEQRLPPFARLDLRASKVWTFDTFLLELYLDLFNASLSAEVLGYGYGVQDTAGGGRTLEKEPFAIPLVLPFLGLKGVY